MDEKLKEEVMNPVNFESLTLFQKIDFGWKKIRQFCFITVEHKYFELFIILMIVLSSIALVCMICLGILQKKTWKN